MISAVGLLWHSKEDLFFKPACSNFRTESLAQSQSSKAIESKSSGDKAIRPIHFNLRSQVLQYNSSYHRDLHSSSAGTFKWIALYVQTKMTARQLHRMSNVLLVPPSQTHPTFASGTPSLLNASQDTTRPDRRCASSKRSREIVIGIIQIRGLEEIAIGLLSHNRAAKKREDTSHIQQR